MESRHRKPHALGGVRGLLRAAIKRLSAGSTLALKFAVDADRYGHLIVTVHQGEVVAPTTFAGYAVRVVNGGPRVKRKRP